MNYIRPLPITNNAGSSHVNVLGNAINSKHIIGGSGIQVSHGPNGTLIELVPQYTTPFMRWAGDFDIDLAYYPGDVVRVRADKIYVNEEGFIIPFGTTDVSGFINEEGGTIPPIAIGLFVCNKTVGPEFLNDDFITSKIAPQFSNLPDGYLSGGRWFNYNTYYPMFPEIPTSFTASVSVAGGTLTANDSYWTSLPMGGYAKRDCVGGTQQTVYDLLIVSGSSFQTEYLKYSG